ncbi:phage tail sheath family protein [Undibacterium seohonense]|uniref:Phage tail sheath family protein n=1 Tax=Undibacterium seohonense TaxID=1344950 RepID=A0ABR6X1N8_9BURK|nr:phage tail sheath C-terminal domain-containing protein [Undibacterium seohonense]MBC3806827.1 phage tail sheath family protein [Undibacterium seohonense]
MVTQYKTPGVYINEVNAFPNSIVPVATAIPAFIGYTPKAEYQGKSYLNTPQVISSYAEFAAIYLLDDPMPPADPAKQYQPEYYLVPQAPHVPLSSVGHYMNFGGVVYAILPDPNTLYYMVNSLRLFFQNGGGRAYIVSVGTYGAPSKTPLSDPSVRPVNANALLSDLTTGLAALKNEQEPTMYVFPEATLLSLADNATLMQTALLQASEMQTAVCIFDVIGGDTPDPVLYTNDIENFRNATGNHGLNFGVCYYPFIGTTTMQSAEIDFTNLCGGDVAQLAALLNPPSNPNPAAAAILNAIQNPPANPMTNNQLQAALLAASPSYQQLMNEVLAYANILPASGAMAGVYTVNDSQSGVWQAPANIGIVGAVDLPIRLTDTQQENLNVDAVTGKSINAIRLFNGRGILVWGARTLDGNSLDWRYIPVRRTMTYIEQSIKSGLNSLIFSPNDATTWATATSMVVNFLYSLWNQGGLQGASPADAFVVRCGLGSTMTAEDILDSVMTMSVAVAVTHPAEFIVINFRQQLAVDS